MFLIVANLAVYIFQTFLLKTNIYQTEVAFFTLEIWTVLSHMTLPLCIFYRFGHIIWDIDPVLCTL